MLFKAFFPFLLLFLSLDAQAKATGLSEQISTSFLVSGDLQGEYDFSGPLGQLISGATSNTLGSTTAPCEISSLFRKVKFRTQNAIEVWLNFDCTFEGQKSTYKPHRIFLNPEKSSQKIKLPMLAKNLKNILLEFRGISLKSGK